MENLQRAERLYKQAQSTHNERVTQVNLAVRKYENALESRDIQQLKTLFYNFSNEDRDKWTTAFKSFEKIESEMTIRNMEFHQDKVMAMVNVHMKYIGFTYNESQLTWEIEFVPVNEDLLIQKVKETK